jgi:hypothetical protein
MKCARCGAQLDDGALVCGQCGGVVGASYGPAKQVAPRLTASSSPRTGAMPRLGTRVRAILKSPRSEWPVIASEPTTAMEIYTGYAMPLAAIGALALFLAQVTIGFALPLVGVIRADLVTGLAVGLLLFAFSLVHLALLAWIIAGLAKPFGGEPNMLRALKVAAYSYTPVWLAGVLYLMPWLALFWGIACLYGLYLAYVGLPIVMRCRPDRAASYAVVAGAAGFVLFAIFAGVITALMGFGPGIFD